MISLMGIRKQYHKRKNEKNPQNGGKISGNEVTEVVNF